MKVALFATCFNDTMFPELGARPPCSCCERLGVEVDFPVEQTCCGQMHINTGYRQEAVPLVRHFVDMFDGYDAVVAPSGSCAGSVRAPAPDDRPPEPGDPALRRRGRRAGRAGPTSCPSSWSTCWA